MILLDSLLITNEPASTCRVSVFFMIRYNLFEELLAEIDDSLKAAIIDLQLFNVVMGGGKWVFRFEPFHDPVICIPETIDRLFGVSDGKKASALRKGILDEREEIAPLDGRGILKFVDQIVVDHLPYPEIDVRDDLMIEIVGKLLVDVINKNCPFPFLYFLEDILEGFVGLQIGGVISGCGSPIYFFI